LKKCKADLIFLHEVDLNARRTHHLDVAREIAQSLQLNFVFGKEFEEWTQGSSRSPAYQGQATHSPWTEGEAVIALRKAGFRDAVGLPHLCTRSARGLFDQGRSIDWIFLSGPLQSSDGQVHGQVRLSDHFPISFVLSLTS
jgi:endonuclease/exonuclease/phosphatase family metal-dependent hydrolase